jgi:hypothetical protein
MQQSGWRSVLHGIQHDSLQNTRFNIKLIILIFVQQPGTSPAEVTDLCYQVLRSNVSLAPVHQCLGTLSAESHQGSCGCGTNVAVAVEQ